MSGGSIIICFIHVIEKAHAMRLRAAFCLLLNTTASLAGRFVGYGYSITAAAAILICVCG